MLNSIEMHTSPPGRKILYLWKLYKRKKSKKTYGNWRRLTDVRKYQARLADNFADGLYGAIFFW